MLSKYLKEYNLVNEDILPANKFIQRSVKIIKKKILKYFHLHGSIKILINVEVQFSKRTHFETKIETNFFAVSAYHITALNFVNKIILRIFEELFIKFESFTCRGSGWVLDHIIQMNLIIFILKRY